MGFIGEGSRQKIFILFESVSQLFNIILASVQYYVNITVNAMNNETHE